MKKLLHKIELLELLVKGCRVHPAYRAIRPATGKCLPCVEINCECCSSDCNCSSCNCGDLDDCVTCECCETDCTTKSERCICD